MLDLIKTTGLRFTWISALIFVFDQWSKYAIVDSMRLYESIQLTGFFNLTYVHNYGAAFSFLYDAGGWQVY
ncbi:MAG: signal peptidase II, partial [Glaciecola sp.]